MRFMLVRRWVLFAVTVVVLAYGCYLLGRWQFHRLHNTKQTNSQTRVNLKSDVSPVGDVLAPGRAVPARDEWRRVTATGTYQADESVIIRYQTRDGGTGVDVVTPLRTTAGPTLLVDRGWMKTTNGAVDKVKAPPPASGQVTVDGWVRVDGSGRSVTVTDHSARAISSVQIAKILSGPVYGGFVDAEKESPAAAKPLVPVELPDLGNGPHFFYGLQWWFFGLLAVFGFFYLAYDERKRLHTPARPTPADSQSAERAPVDREHHAGDEARSR